MDLAAPSWPAGGRTPNSSKAVHLVMHEAMSLRCIRSGLQDEDSPLQALERGCQVLRDFSLLARTLKAGSMERLFDQGRFGLPAIRHP